LRRFLVLFSALLLRMASRCVTTPITLGKPCV
jgi:hypothetical protein